MKCCASVDTIVRKSRVRSSTEGPTEVRDIYKVRDEVTTPVEDFDSLEKSWRNSDFSSSGNRSRDRAVPAWWCDGSLRVLPRMDGSSRSRVSPPRSRRLSTPLAFPRDVHERAARRFVAASSIGPESARPSATANWRAL